MPSSVELAWVLLTLVVAMLIAIFVATRLSRRILPSLDSVAISLRQLAEGEPAFADAARAPDADQAPTGPYGLTVRQVDVLRMLASGGSNKEIAREMGISPGTVKNHLNAIFTKMGAANRTQAVMMARSALEQDAAG